MGQNQSAPGGGGGQEGKDKQVSEVAGLSARSARLRSSDQTS